MVQKILKMWRILSVFTTLLFLRIILAIILRMCKPPLCSRSFYLRHVLVMFWLQSFKGTVICVSIESLYLFHARMICSLYCSNKHTCLVLLTLPLLLLALSYSLSALTCEPSVMNPIPRAICRISTIICSRIFSHEYGDRIFESEYF